MTFPVWRAVLPDTDFYIWLPNFFLPCYSGFSDIFRVLRYCAVALQFWLFVISANARKRKKTARVPTSGGVPNVVLTFGSLLFPASTVTIQYVLGWVNLYQKFEIEKYTVCGKLILTQKKWKGI